ncbi:hypothetical protein OAP25_01000 [Flavobacteriaceae bacterium]|nr:hypothetical protein [Flavobacteriaceae bacterium]
MPKLTLLDMTQDILSDMDSDDVNSINDTPDSLQVAGILKSSFYDLIDSKDSWPHLRGLMPLDSATTARPTHMKLPENVKELTLLKYDKRKSGETQAKYQDVEYKYPDEFLAIVNSYKTDEPNVISVTDFSDAKIAVKTDQAPQYWTSFDDEYIVFNSYDSSVETNLQQSKSQCMASRSPSWTLSDDFIPDLPDEAFSRLLAEAKAACFSRLKQLTDNKAEQQAIRQRNAMSRKSWRAAGGIRMPDYSRRGLK